MFYVHFAASRFCLMPQTSLYCRKVSPALTGTSRAGKAALCNLAFTGF